MAGDFTSAPRSTEGWWVLESKLGSSGSADLATPQDRWSAVAGTLSSRRRGSGRVQFHRPKRLTRAGNRGADDEGVDEDPGGEAGGEDLQESEGAVAMDTKGEVRMSAALVTRRPVRPIPSITAVGVSWWVSQLSRMRGSMKTS